MQTKYNPTEIFLRAMADTRLFMLLTMHRKLREIEEKKQNKNKNYQKQILSILNRNA